MPQRDPYGRRTTSRSRGRTHERILAMQHGSNELPGAQDLLADAPVGSVAACVGDFNSGWLAPSLQVTARRAYERSMVLLLRDLAENGPDPRGPVQQLARARFEQHLEWRVERRLVDRTELLRCTVHLARLGAWLDERHGTSLEIDRTQLRDHASQLAG